tara:strand:+ start:620 stop:1366 length:747 start_codon:yes stop_codon:yes gene_type:complete
MPPPPKFTSKQASIKFEEFLATIRTNEGYAPTNRFEVLLKPPAGVATKNELIELSLRCRDISLPGRNLNTLTDSNIYGPTREIVNGVTYAEDITINFIASSGLEERILFESWQQLTFNDSTWDLGYYNDYVGEIDIYILNRQNERRYGIKLKEAFPKTISPSDLSMEIKDQIMILPVSFAFRCWEPLDKERVPNHATPENPGMGTGTSVSNGSGGKKTYWVNGKEVTKEEYDQTMRYVGQLRAGMPKL